jgi:hypothetical protein
MPFTGNEGKTVDGPLEDALEALARERAEILNAIRQEIDGKENFCAAVDILQPSNSKRREFAKDHVTEIVAQYRGDVSADAKELPSRRDRREALERMARAAHTLGATWRRLPVGDRLRLETAGGPELVAMIRALENADVDLTDLFRRLEDAAPIAAGEISGEKGGAPRELARHNLAQSCLRLYAEFRKDGRSTGATKGGYMDFLRRVHQLATDEEANLERVAKDAYQALKERTEIFGITIRDRTKDW